MTASRRTYTATFRRSDKGAWEVTLAEEPNVQGYGDSLVEARRNIRDAITTMFGPFGAEGDRLELIEDIRLPDAVVEMVNLGRLQRRQGGQQLAEARAAEEAVVAPIQEAVAATRGAGRLLVEHGILVETQADDFGLFDDIRLPESIMHTVERAHVKRQKAHQQRQAAIAAREAASASCAEAVATNREACRLLIEDCGLTITEAADVVGLSPERTQRLLAE